jgi:predicted nucleic acid-binding protein
MAAWLVGEPATTVDFDIDEILGDRVFAVPSHWPIEIGNVLRTNLQNGRLRIDDFREILDRLDLLDIRIEPPLDIGDIGPLAQFAMIYELTAYDAAYVQLALHRRMTLGTLDKAMRRAAVKLNIALLPV